MRPPLDRPRPAFRRYALAAGLGCLAALSGCSLSPSSGPSVPAPLPPAYTPPVAAGQFCLDQLAERGIGFDMATMGASLGYCTITNGVRVERLLADFDQEATMTYPMALPVVDFELHVIHMASQSMFQQR